ncbi:MAG: protein phosphatase 2C domain-containing protein [Ilumatobacter sp.]|nr:protein phosphatase 2C domain-containing protein [Ilumatobacter sp.]
MGAEVDEDTTPTEEDGVLAQMRLDGSLGPFRVVDWAGDSDIGSVRAANEDDWAAVDDRLFVVADGIGGNAGGALAASTAVAHVAATVRDVTEGSAHDVLAAANAEVVVAGRAAGTPRLGTTFVMVSAHRSHVVVVSVGDSRVYRSRDGALELLTRDHTIRNELLASGVPLEAVARRRVRLDALTSFLGRSSGVGAFDALSFSIAAGDRLVICTDGVHGQLTDARMIEAMSAPTCREVVDDLLRAARGEGGRDNATAIVVEFDRLAEHTERLEVR